MAGTGFLKRGIALLLVLPALLVQAAAQTDDPAERVSSDRLDYYLLQAFHAARADQRATLWHLGLITEVTAQGQVVSAMLNGYPAEQAGLRRGDVLLTVDGKPFHPVHNLNPQSGDVKEDATEATPVELVYRRNGVEQTVRVTAVHDNLFDAYRGATANSVQQFSNGNKVIGYLKLWSLDRSANGLQSFRQLVDSLSHCDGLIIDLRDSYGFINVNHLDFFLPGRNRLFTALGQHSDFWQERQPAPVVDRYYSRAIVILQNRGTRGGVELFAYQLARQQRIVSLGEPTAGMAGRVSVEEGGNLFYRPATGVTVDGAILENSGFAPEREVSYPLLESLPADPQFDAAMLALMEII